MIDTRKESWPILQCAHDFIVVVMLHIYSSRRMHVQHSDDDGILIELVMYNYYCFKKIVYKSEYYQSVSDLQPVFY